MRRKLAFFLSLCLLLTLWGCQAAPPLMKAGAKFAAEPAPAPAPEAIPVADPGQTPCAVYSTDGGVQAGETVNAFRRNHGLKVTVDPDYPDLGESPVWELHWRWTQPVVTGIPAAEAVNEVLAQDTRDYLTALPDWAAEARTFAEEIQQNSEETVTTVATMWELNRGEELTRLDDTVVSVLYSDYDLIKGGVHGFVHYWGRTLDAQTGRPLSLADLSDDETALYATCLDCICDGLDDRGFVVFGREGLPNIIADGSWCFTARGLMFFADPYDLDCYAAGRTRFTVTYEELKGVLDDRWMPRTAEPAPGGLRLYTDPVEEDRLAAHVVPAGCEEAPLLAFQAEERLAGLIVAEYDQYEQQSYINGYLSQFGKLERGQCFGIRYPVGQDVALAPYANKDYPPVSTTLRLICFTEDLETCTYQIYLDETGAPVLERRPAGKSPLRDCNFSRDGL